MELIDYSGESMDDHPNSWSALAFKKYFMSTYWKTHRVGGAIPWTLKETALLSKVLKEFSHQDVADMMVYWHTNTSRAVIASQFSRFYSQRVQIYHSMKRTVNDYSWE